MTDIIRHQLRKHFDEIGLEVVIGVSLKQELYFKYISIHLKNYVTCIIFFYKDDL